MRTRQGSLHRVREDLAVLAMTLSVAGAGQAQEHPRHALGTVDFPVSCSESAQVQFNRAVALLHHMTYPQARQLFEQVAATDPQCAMAHWGIAMTLFQPLWPTRPGAEALRRGWEAVQKARALRPPTRREELFVAAAEAFFRDPTSSDYRARIGRWEQAMEQVHSAFPQDLEASAFYALAHLAAAPPDETSQAYSDRAAEVLLAVHGRNPDHPGAMHYLVHANDAPGREHESLDVVRKYETLAPGNPHALHMPTHIYTRLGDWDAVIRGNLRAAQAALEYPAGDHGQYVWDEFPHAIEYLIYAYLQEGADSDAAAQLERLKTTARLQPTFKTAFHLASTQTRYALERRAWDEAMLLDVGGPEGTGHRFAWPEAVAWFGRGLGAAHKGDIDRTQPVVARLEQLEAAADKAGEALFARNIRILRLELSAWLKHAMHEEASSVELMRQAVDLEASTPKHAVTPAPTLPASELMGDLLLEQARPAQALTAYQRSLERYPRRFNSLLGAARGARASGDAAAAASFYEALLEVADGGARESVLEEARAFVSMQR